MPRSSSILLLAAGLTACFSPEVGTETNMNASGTETDADPTTTTRAPGSEDSTAGETATTGVDPNTTVGATETEADTTAADAPPIFESFTVNGSTMPSEVSEGGTITFEAEAIDDVGVVSVEFFDAETSLGVVEDAPYELEVPVSSADSGPHTYSAVATDTGGQTGVSEEITMSVNIVGGVIEVVREDLFVGADGLMIVNGGLDAGMDDRVFLSAVLDGGGSSQVMGFNDGLSQLWSQTYDTQIPGGPATVGDALVVGGTDSDELDLVYRTLAPATGDTVESLTFETTAESSGDLLGAGMVGSFDGRFAFSESLQLFSAYSPDLDERLWLANSPRPIDLAALGPALFMSFGQASDDCAMSSNFCIRRYDTEGQIAWTAGLPSSSPGYVAPHPDGGLFAAAGSGDMGYEVFRISPAGMVSSLGVFDAADEQYVSAATADGAGGLVVSGSTGQYAIGRAFVTRIDGDGNVVWDQRQFFNNNVESAALDVVADGGDVFVYGLSNNISGFIGFSGDAWVARITL